MMTPRPLPVKKIERMGVATDGQCALLHLLLADGRDQLLAFPTGLLGSLMCLTAGVAGDAQRLTGRPTSIPVERGDVRKADDQQTILLSFPLPGGAEIKFRLARSAADLFCDALETSLGRLSSAHEGGSTH
jgi:hypothetical protein